MVQVPVRLECLNASEPDQAFIIKDEGCSHRRGFNEEFGIFPMKTTSKTTAKTIFKLIAASSLLFTLGYQGWEQSTALASPAPLGTIPKSPISPKPPISGGVTTPSSTTPTTQLPPTTSPGSGDLTTPPGTTPITPVPPTGGGTMPDPTMPMPKAPTTIPGQPSTSISGSTIVSVVGKNKQLTKLTAAIKEAGLEETLSGKGPFTVFAPTDEAFAALPPKELDALLKNKPLLIPARKTHHD
jgi:Fasciclin domain